MLGFFVAEFAGWAAHAATVTGPARSHATVDEAKWRHNTSYPEALQKILRHKSLIGGTSGLVPENDVFMGTVELAPRAYYPAHVHPAPEIYFVLSGRGRWTIGEETFDAAPGTAIYHPPNASHRIVNTGDEPLVSVFFWWAPGGDRAPLKVSSRLVEPLPEQTAQIDPVSTETVPAKALAQPHRDYLVAHLEMTREFVRDTTRGLTNEQWLHSPGAKQWSTAQCIEHLARTEEYVLQMVRERLLPATAPLVNAFPSISKSRLQAVAQPKPMGPAEDAWVLRWITDRMPQATTPVENRPPIVEIAPRDQIDDPAAVLAHFLKVRAATIEYIRTTADDLRGHSANARMLEFPHMPFTDGYQWILRMSGHTERHLMQVHAIRMSPGYPTTKPPSIGEK